MERRDKEADKVWRGVFSLALADSTLPFWRQKLVLDLDTVELVMDGSS